MQLDHAKTNMHHKVERLTLLSLLGQPVDGISNIATPLSLTSLL